MKRLFILAWLVLAATPAGSAAQARIDLYADAAMSGCEILDTGPMFLEVHMVYSGPAANAVRFRAPKPECWVGAMFVGDIIPFISTGNSQLDLMIGFGDCLSGQVHMGFARYYATGQAMTCCVLPVLPAFQFVYSDCGYAEHPLAAGQSVVINPNEACRCQQPLPTEPSTWGRVKSLYR